MGKRAVTISHMISHGTFVAGVKTDRRFKWTTLETVGLCQRQILSLAELSIHEPSQATEAHGKSVYNQRYIAA